MSQPLTRIHPVIHLGPFDFDHTMTQVGIATRQRASGVFLISHNGDDAEVVRRAQAVKERCPNLRVGINLLSTTNLQAMEHAAQAGLDMLWVDAPGLSSAGVTQEALDLSAIALKKPYIEVFASVAFKYQGVDADPARAAERAMRLGFKATTSGAATGSAPTLEKISSMSHAVNGQLAVASGMTPDNVRPFSRHLSDILVATGVSLNEYEIDERKLAMLIAVVENEHKNRHEAKAA